MRRFALRELQSALAAGASTLASAAAGSTYSSSRIIRDLAKEHGGKPEATIWFECLNAIHRLDRVKNVSELTRMIQPG